MIHNKPKIGDTIIYRGTKEGSSDSQWEKYFGKYGVKKGDVGIISIQEGTHYFVKDKKRGPDYTSGYLTIHDFIVAKTWKERYTGEK